MARAYRVSERLLRERNLITFGAQLLQAVELLRADENRLAALREQYRYILVDEFQDTNIAQLELLWLLAGERRNILAVGDDSQAIYRFRGASFGSFTIFLDRFCGAAKEAPVERLAAEVADAELPLDAANFARGRRSDPAQRAAAVACHTRRWSRKIPRAKKSASWNLRRRRKRRIGWPSEIERLHKAGRAWRSCAVLYRKHMHRAEIVEALQRRNIPFVIRRLSMLSSTLVRDLVAYLRLIAVPSDNVACARVMAAPYWRFEPRDLVRLAERARKNKSLMDALESPQQEFAFGSQARVAELLAFLKRLRQLASRAPARTVFDALVAELGLSPLPSDADRMHLERFAKFLEEWEAKSEEKSLAAFIEYFDFFLQADGDIAQTEESADDAVQLMTVHNAKGMEFDHVFVLTVSEGDFPARPQAPVLEFPAALMKEEQPKGEFRIQEERRLFYVALTRARRLLTISTVINRRKKPSPFLEDILADPRLKKAHAEQLTPKVRAAEGRRDGWIVSREPAATATVPDDSRRFARVFANRVVGQGVPSAQRRAAAIERVGHRNVSDMPDEVSAAASVGNPRRTASGHDVRQRDALDDSRIRARNPQTEKRAVRGSGGDFRARVARGGISGQLSGRGIPKSGAGTVASFLRKLRERAGGCSLSGEGVRAAARSQRGGFWAHGPDQPAGAKRNRNRGLQDRESQAREARQREFTAQFVRAGGARSAGARSRAAGVLQLDDK